MVKNISDTGSTREKTKKSFLMAPYSTQRKNSVRPCPSPRQLETKRSRTATIPLVKPPMQSTDTQVSYCPTKPVVAGRRLGGHCGFGSSCDSSPDATVVPFLCSTPTM